MVSLVEILVKYVTEWYKFRLERFGIIKKNSRFNIKTRLITHLSKLGLRGAAGGAGTGAVARGEANS